MKRTSILIVAGCVLALGACRRDGAMAVPEALDKPAAGQPRYVTPPSVTEGVASGDGVALNGQAAPGARVRLASPSGEAVFAEADAQGRWRMSLRDAEAARLFGLSMTTDGRQVQSQGYVLVAPQGRVALLRAGAGALVLDADDEARITALDFDAEGGAVASGVAPAETAVTVRVDDRQIGEGRSDAAGRFSIAFNQPLSAGRRRIVVEGASWAAEASFDVTPAAPIAGAPYRAGAQNGVLRVDWLTPGGGLQTTLIRN